LRESGAIEQDADVVLFLHRERDATDTTLSVAKHRHGEEGDIQLRWIPQETRFEDAVEDFGGYSG